MENETSEPVIKIREGISTEAFVSVIREERYWAVSKVLRTLPSIHAEIRIKIGPMSDCTPCLNETSPSRMRFEPLEGYRPMATTEARRLERVSTSGPASDPKAAAIFRSVTGRKGSEQPSR